MFILISTVKIIINIYTLKKYLPLIIVFFIFREEHRKLHAAHIGHESMHAEMLLILMVTMIVAQIVLIEWKRRHFKSFQVNIISILKIFLVFCFCASIYLLCVHIDCFINSLMGNTVNNVHPHVILEVYCILGIIFCDHCTCCSKSIRKTLARVHSKVYNY